MESCVAVNLENGFESAQPLEIGIIGGGITGLTAAFYLLRAGHRVTVFEARSGIGGLASSFDFGPFFWDKFYHCILTSDAPLLQLLDDLGLRQELRWTETKVGFFAGDRLHSFTTTLDFLRFPILSVWQKLRLAAGILYCSRIPDGRALEQEPIGPWLQKVFGRNNYRKLWEPLLKCKLGPAREQTSASFIWATIKRLYSTRERSVSQKECLGYVRGGYKAVFSRLVERIGALEGKIVTGAKIHEICSVDGDRISIATSDGRQPFDYVISTIPSSPFSALTPELETGYRRQLERVQYMGIVCPVLLLRRKLTPYYCTNITEDLPFTGIIEMTNLISVDETRGRHLVYLPKYTSPADPLFQADDEQVWRLFYPALKRVIPDLRDDDIETRFLFRERLVQPIPVLDYSSLVPAMQTSVPHLLLANTTQIVNSTLNNNEMVKIARAAADLVLRKHRSEADAAHVHHAAILGATGTGG